MDGRRLRVLVVDDDEDDYLLICDLLSEAESRWFELDWVARYDDALKAIKRQEHDVYLVDFRLGARDGLELLRHARENRCAAPIILLTGQGDHEVDVEAMRAGAADYLVKMQIDAQLLERSIRYAIKHKQAERALRESKRKIEDLHHTARSLGSCESEDEVYQLVIEASRHILSFTRCVLYIVESNKLVIKATSGSFSPEAGIQRDDEESDLAQQAYQTGETFIFGNSGEGLKAESIQEGFTSGISSPIDDIGVFQVISEEPNAFDVEDVRLLELMLGHTIEAVKRIRLQSQLHDQAIRDSLTGVYNRRYFMEAITREVERSKRYRHSIGFLMIDVDRFKLINDTFGHQMGDRTLQEIANFLRKQAREGDMVVRYGGDEFLIVMPETGNEIDMMKKRILETFAQWHENNDLFGFPVTLSIGDAHWSPADSQSIEKVLAKADERMYDHKRRHIGNVVCFGS